MYPGGRAPANSGGVIEGDAAGSPEFAAYYEPDQLISPDQFLDYSNGGNTIPVVQQENADMNPGLLGEVSSAARNATARPARYRVWIESHVQEWSREPFSTGLHQNIGTRAWAADWDTPRQLPYDEQLRTARNRPEAAWDSGYVIGEQGDYAYAGLTIGGV